MIILPVASIAITALFLLAFVDDDSEKFAKVLISNEHGDFNYQIISTALEGRFPVGSDPENLRLFVEKTGGYCFSSEYNNMVCNLPYKVSFCVSDRIQIEIPETADGKIEKIKAKFSADAC